MRVRVWIRGADGPSHDFELLIAPRIGERVCVVQQGRAEEGVVAAVTWQLQAMDAAGPDLGVDAEPAGTVSMVHVICRPGPETVQADEARATIADESTRTA